MTPIDLSIKGAIEEFEQGAAVNPIQQAIEALENSAPSFAGKEAHAKHRNAITSLRSLQKEVEVVELPKFPLHDVAATAPGVVWLNIFGVESDYESGFPEDHEGITWCESEVGDLDVPYVRVDRVAAVAAALGRGAVPSGWKLVPVEPTPEMRKAAADAWLDCDSKLFLNKAGAAVRAAIAISKESA